MYALPTFAYLCVEWATGGDVVRVLVPRGGICMCIRHPDVLLVLDLTTAAPCMHAGKR